MQTDLEASVNCSYEDGALVPSKAARIVHEDILNSNGFQFTGSFFSPNCQQDSMPTNLQVFCYQMDPVSNYLPGYTSQLQKKSSKTTTRHLRGKKWSHHLPLHIVLDLGSYTNEI